MFAPLKKKSQHSNLVPFKVLLMFLVEVWTRLVGGRWGQLSDSRNTLKTNANGYPNKSVMRHEKKKGVRDDPKFFWCN